MSIRTALLPVSLLLAGATYATIAPVAQEDHSSLPPEPAVVYAQLGAMSTSLTDAVKIAESQTEGRAASVALSADGKSYSVDIYTTNGRRAVTINSGTGTLTSNDSVSRFPGREVSGTWTETPSGLKYYDIVVGDGASPAGPTATVTVHYSGWLLDGTKFDSSVDRGEPISFALNGVIKGWTEGVQSMKIGGFRKLIIPFDLAYGEGGRPPVIPAKATLVFDIELISL